MHFFTALSDSPARRRSVLRRAAWVCAVLVLVVTSLSAFLRQSGAALGCTPWPACHARAARGEAPAQAGAAARGARAMHRISAAALLVLLLGMAPLAWVGKFRLADEGRHILVALALVLFLAVLGPFTTGSRLPAVTLGNLLAGLVLFAVCVRLAADFSPAPMPSIASLRRWAWISGTLLLLQIALGALVSAGYAGLVCPQLAVCSPGPDGWQALSPWHVPGIGAGTPDYAGGVGVQLVHRVGALAVMAALTALAVAAWRAGRRKTAAALMVCAILQTEVGLALILAELPLGAALAHNLLAALLLAAVATLLPRAAPQSRGF